MLVLWPSLSIFMTVLTFIFIEVFRLLNVLCKEQKIPISAFMIKNHEITDMMMGILRIIKKKLNWKRSKMVLIRRIRRIANNDKFSVRDTKYLRKLINKQIKKGYTDFEEVLYEFPGKTVEMLEKKYNEKFNYLTGRIEE